MTGLHYRKCTWAYRVFTLSVTNQWQHIIEEWSLHCPVCFVALQFHLAYDTVDSFNTDLHPKHFDQRRTPILTIIKQHNDLSTTKWQIGNDLICMQSGHSFLPIFQENSCWQLIVKRSKNVILEGNAQGKLQIQHSWWNNLIYNFSHSLKYELCGF